MFGPGKRDVSVITKLKRTGLFALVERPPLFAAKGPGLRPELGPPNPSDSLLWIPLRHQRKSLIFFRWYFWGFLGSELPRNDNLKMVWFDLKKCANKKM